MTRSITIVNTSNWHGENIRLKLDNNSEYVLRPAEKLNLWDSRKEWNLKIVNEKGGKIRPITGQVIPIVDVNYDFVSEKPGYHEEANPLNLPEETK